MFPFPYREAATSLRWLEPSYKPTKIELVQGFFGLEVAEKGYIADLAPSVDEAGPSRLYVANQEKK